MMDFTQFGARVRERFEGTPYAFEEDDGGFTVRREVVRWVRRDRGRRVLMHCRYAYEVRTGDDGSYRLAIESRRRRAGDDAPAELRDDGFRPQHAPDAIKAIGDELGLRRRLGATGVVAIGLGVVGALGAVAAVVALLLA